MSLPYSFLCFHIYLCSRITTMATVNVRMVNMTMKWATRKKMMVEAKDMVMTVVVMVVG